MEQHGLRQSDLPELGPQSVVSAVLSGKRALNLRQVKALAARFHVPMEALTGQTVGAGGTATTVVVCATSRRRVPSRTTRPRVSSVASVR